MEEKKIKKKKLTLTVSSKKTFTCSSLYTEQSQEIGCYRKKISKKMGRKKNSATS